VHLKHPLQLVELVEQVVVEMDKLLLILALLQQTEQPIKVVVVAELVTLVLMAVLEQAVLV
jgi:hypothetical protein